MKEQKTNQWQQTSETGKNPFQRQISILEKLEAVLSQQVEGDVQLMAELQEKLAKLKKKQ